MGKGVYFPLAFSKDRGYYIMVLIITIEISFPENSFIFCDTREIFSKPSSPTD